MNTDNTDPREGFGAAPENPDASNSYAGQFQHSAPQPMPAAAQPPYGGVGNDGSYGGGSYGGGAYGGGGMYGPPVPPYFAPEPPKPKRRWSTALLVLTAAFSLVLGGAIGTQLDKVMQESPTADSTNSQLEQQQQEQQEQQQNPFQSPQANDPNGESGTELDAGEKVDSAPGVVLINTLLFNGAGAGTGMILDSDGLILTNYHVVTGSETVSVTVSDTGEEYEAEVLGHDAVRDVAVLQITDGSGFDTVQTDTAGLSEGDAVSAIGNGSGQGYLTELQGSVTGLDQTITAMDEMSSSSDGEVLTGLISTDADVVPGYSGGPLVNESGAVVGMTTAASQGTTSEQVSGYAVPISTALDIADQISSGNITSDTIVMGKSAALGVTVAGGNTPGAQIVEVLEGSAAADAGLTEGDTITALDGNPVNNASVLSSLVKEYEIGDTVTLDVTTQDGSQKQVDVKLGESTVN